MDLLPERTFAGDAPAVVALHGFTQHGGMFEELASFLSRGIVAPDLPGHGEAARIPTRFTSVVQAVAKLTRGRPLLGYSQGGRIALGVALEHPDAVSHLILVSAGFGITDDRERRRRRRADNRLATRIERDHIERFIDEWMSRPIFDGLRQRGAGWLERDRAVRLENTPDGLAAALRGMGQGVQPVYEKRLGEIRMPVLVLVGESDPKYVEVGERIVEHVERGSLIVVEGTGHPLIGEDPERVAGEVERFLIGSETL